MSYKIVLIRHGESEWNLKNLFTGWSDPDLSETERKDGSGKTHEQPGRHIRSLGRHSCDPGTHGTPAEEIVLLVLVASVEIENQPDKKQNNEISQENKNFSIKHKKHPFCAAPRNAGSLSGTVCRKYSYHAILSWKKMK